MDEDDLRGLLANTYHRIGRTKYFEILRTLGVQPDDYTAEARYFIRRPSELTKFLLLVG